MRASADITEQPEVDLSPDERVIAIFQPKLGLFLHRTLLVASMTAVLLMGFPKIGLGIVFALVGGLISALFYAFVFGDFEEWRQRRRDRWILTNQRLCFQNPEDDDGVAWINLSDIQTCRRWMWWAVRLTTLDRRVTVLRYVGPVKAVQTILRSAIADAKGDPNVG
ncbi:MAG: hypothetical protein ACRBBQ_03475 [Cognatishimia sp.]